MMTHSVHRSHATVAALFLTLTVAIVATACSTAPKRRNQPAFIAEARAATRWFEGNVPGLRAQIDDSAGYIVFPSVGQWGIIYTGGKFGRGMLNCRIEVMRQLPLCS